MLVIYLLTIGCLVAPSLQHRAPVKNMTIVHVWNNLEYDFESQEDLEYALQSGIYKEEGFKRPYDVDVFIKKDKNAVVLLSTPRIVPGIPYTLAKVSDKKGNFGPKLLPYPNFAAHSALQTPNCDRIISVFRIFVDPCKRLWAIDTGRHFQVTPTQVCPPKILVYDLETDELILKYVIPEGQYIPEKTVHNGIIIDIYDPPPKGKCRKGKAYLTDARGYSFLVFDLETETSWMISNELFKPDPTYIPTTIAGQTFQFPDGLYTSTPYRDLDSIFLHPWASLFEIAAPLSKVNNRSLWQDNPSGNQNVFQVIGSRPTQSATQTKDSKGNIYFSILNPLSILSWNPRDTYKISNFDTVAENSDTLQYVAGLKVGFNSKKQEVLLALSIRLQKLDTGTISLNEENYRLMVCKISTLRNGKGKCGDL